MSVLQIFSIFSILPLEFFENRDLYRGTSHWFLTGLGICFFTLSLFFLRSFAQRVTVSKSLMSLFKKKQLCTNCSPCTLLKTRVSDLLFFTSKLLFCLQKTSDSQIKLYFLYVLDIFSLFKPKSKSLPLLITKEWPSLLTREQWESHSYSRVQILLPCDSREGIRRIIFFILTGSVFFWCGQRCLFRRYRVLVIHFLICLNICLNFSYDTHIYA